MSDTPNTLERLTRIAHAVAEETATRTQKANLPGVCDVVARALVEAAKAHGIAVELACGRYSPDTSRQYRKYMETLARTIEGAPQQIGRRPVTHYWVRWNGHHVDPTVKQSARPRPCMLVPSPSSASRRLNSCTARPLSKNERANKRNSPTLPRKPG